MKKCIGCGKMYDNDSIQFCTECGHALELCNDEPEAVSEPVDYQNDSSYQNNQQDELPSNNNEAMTDESAQPQEPKKSKKGLIIALVIVLIAAIGGLVYWFCLRNNVATLSEAFKNLSEIENFTMNTRLSIKSSDNEVQTETRLIADDDKGYATIKNDEESISYAIVLDPKDPDSMTVAMKQDKWEAVKINAPEEEAEDFDFDETMNSLNDILVQYAQVDLNDHIQLDKIDDTFEKAFDYLGSKEAAKKVWNKKLEGNVYSFDFDVKDIIDIFVDEYSAIFKDKEEFGEIKKELKNALAEFAATGHAEITVEDEIITKISVKMDIAVSGEKAAFDFYCSFTDIGETAVEFGSDLKAAIENAKVEDLNDLADQITSMIPLLGGGMGELPMPGADDEVTELAYTSFMNYITQTNDMLDIGSFIFLTDGQTDYWYVVEEEDLKQVDSTDERVQSFYQDSAKTDYWCKQTVEEGKYTVMIFEEDKIVTKAFDDMVTTHEAAIDAGKEIPDGAVFVWKSNGDVVIMQCNQGYMEWLSTTEQEIKQDMKKLSMKNVKGAKKTVTVYVYKNA